MTDYQSKNPFFFGTDCENIDIDTYMKKINEITNYYDEQSTKYKKIFYACCVLRIFSSAIIPIVALGSVINVYTVIVSILAFLITIAESLVNVTRCYDKWTKYRLTCNSLWIEQRSFAARRAKYDNDENRNKIFIETCESLIEGEVIGWKEYIKRAQEMF